MRLKNGWSRIKDLTQETRASVSDFENAVLSEEFVHRMLCDPTSQTYSALNQWLKICPHDWISDFLACGGLKYMFAGLTYMNLKGSTKFTDTVVQLEVVHGIKLVINCVAGIEYLISSKDDLIHVMVLCKYSSSFKHDKKKNSSFVYLSLARLSQRIWGRRHREVQLIKN